MHIFKKIMKVLAFTVLGVLILFVILGLIIDPIAKNYLENKINEVDKGQYSAEIDNVNISLLQGNFIVKDIQLKTDTAKAREKETPVIAMQAGEISVEGVSWLTFLLSGTLQLDRISFLELDIQAKVRSLDPQEDADPFRWKDLNIYPLIEDQIDRIRINDMRFNDLALSLINIETMDTLRVESETFNLQSDDILVDANRVFTDGRSFYASKIDVSGKNLNIRRSGQSSYHVAIDNFEAVTRGNALGFLSENASLLIPGNPNPDTLVFASAREFVIIDLSLQRLVKDSVANIQRIVLKDFAMINNLEADEKEVQRADKNVPGFDISEFSLGDNLPDLLDRVIIHDISLQNINYKQHDNISVNGLDFSSQEMIIDKRPAFGENRFMHASQFGFFIDTVSFLETEQMIHTTFNDLSFEINQGMGSLELNNLTVNHTEQTPGQMFAEVSLNQFLVTGINTKKLTDSVFSVDSIAIVNPGIFIALAETSQKGDESDPVLNLYPAIADYLTVLQINKIAVIEADIKLEGLIGNNDLLHLPRGYLQVFDLRIAEGTAFDGGRILHAADITAMVDGMVVPLPDDVYTVSLDRIKVRMAQGLFELNGLSYDHQGNYLPILKGPESNQVFKIANEKLLIQGLDYAALIKQEGFFARSVISEGMQVDIYKDNHFPAKETEESYPTARQMIKNLDTPMPVSLGEFSIKNASITYEEMAEGGEQAGKFSMDDFDLAIKNFSNAENVINDGLETVIEVNGLLMGAGYFEAELNIPMHDAKQPVIVSGKLDTLDLTRLNQFIEYTSQFGFESGTLYSLLWDFQTVDGVATGKFGMSYENLDVRLSEKKSPDPAGTFYQIGAYLANGLILDDAIAEDISDPPRVAEFSREKDKEEESFVDHYISSLMAGLLELMGFPLSIIDP